MTPPAASVCTKLKLFISTHLLQSPHPLTLKCQVVNLNHFRLLRVVGKGAFGKVRIVERKDTGLPFALKYIRKDEGWHIRTYIQTPPGRSILIPCKVVRSESVRNIIRERKMLEHLNHAFLCNLRYSFQDIEYLYVDTLPLSATTSLNCPAVTNWADTIHYTNPDTLWWT